VEWTLFPKQLLGAVHKGRPLKIDPLAAKSPHRLKHPLLSPYLCGHTINSEKSDVFCTKKCGRPHLKYPSPFVRKMSALDTPTPTADVFYGQPLIKKKKTASFSDHDADNSRISNLLLLLRNRGGGGATRPLPRDGGVEIAKTTSVTSYLD